MFNTMFVVNYVFAHICKIKNIIKPHALIRKIMNFEYTFCIFPKIVKKNMLEVLVFTRTQGTF